MESIELSPVTESDVTYSLVLEDSIEIVAIGSIFTQAKPEHVMPTEGTHRGAKHFLPHN